MNRFSLALALSLLAAPSALAAEDTFLQQLREQEAQQQLDALQFQQERMQLQMEDLQYGAEAKAIGEENQRFFDRLLAPPPAPHFYYFPAPPVRSEHKDMTEADWDALMRMHPHQVLPAQE